MALIKCPDCGKDISDSARQGPNCGFELKKEEPSITYVEVRNKPVAHKVGMIMLLITYIFSLITWVYIVIKMPSAGDGQLAIAGMQFQYIGVLISAVGIILAAIATSAKDNFKKYNTMLVAETFLAGLYVLFEAVLMILAPSTLGADYNCCFTVFLVFPVCAIISLAVSWVGMIRAKVK